MRILMKNHNIRCIEIILTRNLIHRHKKNHNIRCIEIKSTDMTKYYMKEEP